MERTTAWTMRPVRTWTVQSAAPRARTRSTAQRPRRWPPPHRPRPRGRPRCSSTSRYARRDPSRRARATPLLSRDGRGGGVCGRTGHVPVHGARDGARRRRGARHAAAPRRPRARRHRRPPARRYAGRDLPVKLPRADAHAGCAALGGPGVAYRPSRRPGTPTAAAHVQGDLRAANKLPPAARLLGRALAAAGRPWPHCGRHRRRLCLHGRPQRPRDGRDSAPGRRRRRRRVRPRVRAGRRPPRRPRSRRRFLGLGAGDGPGLRRARRSRSRSTKRTGG